MPLLYLCSAEIDRTYESDYPDDLWDAMGALIGRRYSSAQQIVRALDATCDRAGCHRYMIAHARDTRGVTYMIRTGPGTQISRSVHP
jgi:hypothetical protein